MADSPQKYAETPPIPGREGGKGRRVAVIVAHPDDETLWAGGLLLTHLDWSTFIVTLCRGKDPDRAPKFAQALAALHATGSQGDLDDGPDQHPLPGSVVRKTILSLLPASRYDLVLTHGPGGEYTRHLRHEEVFRAVLDLWSAGELPARGLWQFAYEDGGGAFLPRPKRDADLHLSLPEAVWSKKYRIITEVYGFGQSSWEARVTPHTEAFYCHAKQDDIHRPDGYGSLLNP